MGADGTRGQAAASGPPAAADRIRAVLLDALGTLVGLEPPAPHLVAALAARGVRVTPAQAGAAARAEMAHYRAEHHRAGTPEGLRVVREECAQVLGRALAPAVDRLAGDELVEVLLSGFRFFAYPEAPAVLAALRGRGLALVVCSNWDLSLHEVLARTGLQELLDGAVVSAVEGVAKPDPALFARALAAAGDVPPGAALHVGDSVDADVEGARAAGVRAVLIRRDGDELRSHEADARPLPPGVPVVSDLRGLLGLV